jgi:hypothetical protein
MKQPCSRRDWLRTVGAAALAFGVPRRPVAAADAPARGMRGVFIILNTPFTAAGEVDWEDLEREVAFVDRAG